MPLAERGRGHPACVGGARAGGGEEGGVGRALVGRGPPARRVEWMVAVVAAHHAARVVGCCMAGVASIAVTRRRGFSVGPGCPGVGRAAAWGVLGCVGRLLTAAAPGHCCCLAV